MSDNKRRQVSAKGWAAKHDESAGSRAVKLPDGVGFYKAKKGVNRLHFCPYIVGKGNPNADEGSLHFERTYFCHRGIGPNGDTYLCPAKHGKGKCPVCEERVKVFDNDDMDDKDKKKALSELAAKERQLWIVIDDDDKDTGPQVWDASYHVFGKFLKGKLDNMEADDDYDLFADPDEGHLVKVTGMEKSGGGFTFNEFNDIEFKKRKHPLDVNPDDMPCLDDMLTVPTYEQLRKAFLALPDDNGKDRDDDAPAKGRQQANSKPAATPKDDDDDDDDAPPPRKAVKPAAKPAPEEDEGTDAPAGKWKADDLCVFGGDECTVLKVNKDGTLNLEGEDGEVYKNVDPGKVKDHPSVTAHRKPAARVAAKPADDDDDESMLDDEDDAPPKKKSRK